MLLSPLVLLVLFAAAALLLPQLPSLLLPAVASSNCSADLG
jgi:hypothetical protein